MTETSSTSIDRLLTNIKQILVVCILLQGIKCAPPARLSTVIADWAQYSHLDHQGRGSYSFGYDIEDPETNNVQFRNEERHPNGTIIGSYGYLEPNGNIHMVHYIADNYGYRATIENSVRSGMLKPIPVRDDFNYAAYGYSPEMIAALASQRVYKNQQLQEQHSRPYDLQKENKENDFFNKVVVSSEKSKD